MEITKGENANQIFKHKDGCTWLTELPTGVGTWGCSCGLDKLLLELEDYEPTAPTPPLDVEAEKRITEIRERESKATKAPWVTIGTSTEREPGCGISSQIGDGSSFRVANIDIDDLEFDEQNNNAEFIAHSRQDIPFLLEQNSLLRCHIASPAPQSQLLIKNSRPIDQMEGSERIAWAAYQVLGCLFGIEGPARIMNWFHDVASGLEPSIDELFPITPEERKRYEWAASPAQPEKRENLLGKVVSVDNPQFTGFGIAQYDSGERKRVIGVKLENGNTWEYDAETVRLATPEEIKQAPRIIQESAAPPQSGKEGQS